MRNVLKNNRGAALAMVIMVMVVLVILGTSILGLALSETKLSIASEKNIQAEYIAKSGADIVAERIINDPTALDSVLDEPLGNGVFSATVTKNANLVTIKSTGNVDGKTKDVSIVMKKQTFFDIFTGIKQTGEGVLDLEALPITYDSGTTVSVEARDTITLHNKKAPYNESDPNIIKSVNTIEWPDFIVPDSTGFETTLPEDKVFVGNYKISGTLGEGYTFDTQGSDQHIIVDKIDLTGDIIVAGGGTVHLYINGKGDDSLVQTPNSNINQNRDGNLIIYVEPNTTLAFHANCNAFNAYIYGPKATIHIQSDKTTIAGSIVGDILTKNKTPNGPHGNFHFTPLDDEPDDEPIPMPYKKEMYLD